jgi:hypothetical protein
MIENVSFKCVIAVACLTIGALGCSIDADFGGTGFLCSDVEPCPSGFECAGGSCVSTGGPPDAAVDAVTTDASPNTPDADPDTPDADPDVPDANQPPDAMPGPDGATACSDPIALVDDFANGTPAPQWTTVR